MGAPMLVTVVTFYCVLVSCFDMCYVAGELQGEESCMMDEHTEHHVTSHDNTPPLVAAQIMNIFIVVAMTMFTYVEAAGTVEHVHNLGESAATRACRWLKSGLLLKLAVAKLVMDMSAMGVIESNNLVVTNAIVMISMMCSVAHVIAVASVLLKSMLSDDGLQAIEVIISGICLFFVYFSPWSTTVFFVATAKAIAASGDFSALPPVVHAESAEVMIGPAMLVCICTITVCVVQQVLGMKKFEELKALIPCCGPMLPSLVSITDNDILAQATTVMARHNRRSVAREQDGILRLLSDRIRVLLKSKADHASKLTTSLIATSLTVLRCNMRRWDMDDCEGRKEMLTTLTDILQSDCQDIEVVNAACTVAQGVLIGADYTRFTPPQALVLAAVRRLSSWGNTRRKSKMPVIRRLSAQHLLHLVAGTLSHCDYRETMSWAVSLSKPPFTFALARALRESSATRKPAANIIALLCEKGSLGSQVRFDAPAKLLSALVDFTNVFGEVDAVIATAQALLLLCHNEFQNIGALIRAGVPKTLLTFGDEFTFQDEMGTSFTVFFSQRNGALLTRAGLAALVGLARRARGTRLFQLAIPENLGTTLKKMLMKYDDASVTQQVVLLKVVLDASIREHKLLKTKFAKSRSSRRKLVKPSEVTSAVPPSALCILCVDFMSDTQRGVCRRGKSKVVSLPCGHLFHQECLHEWQSDYPFCPDLDCLSKMFQAMPKNGNVLTDVIKSLAVDAKVRAQRSASGRVNWKKKKNRRRLKKMSAPASSDAASLHNAIDTNRSSPATDSDVTSSPTKPDPLVDQSHKIPSVSSDDVEPDPQRSAQQSITNGSVGSINDDCEHSDNPDTSSASELCCSDAGTGRAVSADDTGTSASDDDNTSPGDNVDVGSNADSELMQAARIPSAEVRTAATGAATVPPGDDVLRQPAATVAVATPAAPKVQMSVPPASSPRSMDDHTSSRRKTAFRKRLCSWCETAIKGKRYVCGRCRAVVYCGRECQGSHWETHKPLCIPYGAVPDL